jgi:hypothetical protein
VVLVLLIWSLVDSHGEFWIDPPKLHETLTMGGC